MAEDAWLHRRPLLHRLRFLTRVLQPGMVFVDVGAEAGLFSLATAHWTQAGHVIACEDLPSALALLEENVALNQHVNGIPIPIFAEDVDLSTGLLRAQGENAAQIVRVGKADVEERFFDRNQSVLSSETAPLVFYDAPMRQHTGLDYHPVEVMWRLQEYGFALYTLDPLNGAVCRRPMGHYEGPIIAVKPQHPSYPLLEMETS